MKTTIRGGKYVLIHERRLDAMGFEIDNFDLFDTEKRIHRPFNGDLKVSNERKDFPVNKIPYDYTNDDYLKMMKEQIAKIS